MGLPFLSSRGKRREQVVVFDLGGRTTKAVHVQRRGDKLCLASFAITDAPTTDKAPSPVLLADHLKTVNRLLGTGRSRSIALVVGVAETLFRQVEVPTMPADHVRQMLKYNAKTYLQQDLQDYVFDCCFVPPRPGTTAEAPKAGGNPKQRVFVTGIRQQLLGDLQTAAKGAGLVPELVVPGVLGPINAFELAEPEVFAKETVALVDIGFKHTTIVILNQGEIMLNRVVPLGGDHLTRGLAEALETQYAEAEQIKLGLADKPEMAEEVQPTLTPLIYPLGRELRASIDYFEHQHEKPVAQAFFSGGTARSEFVLQTLQADLMVPCKTWNPVQPLQLTLEPQKMGEIEEAAPHLTVALGAAVSAF